MDKDPTTYSLLTYLWVLGLSLWAGMVSYFRKVRDDKLHLFSLVTFIGEMATSAFIGIMTFWLCEAAEMNRLYSAAMVGVAAHMGSRAIFYFEEWLKRKFPK